MPYRLYMPALTLAILSAPGISQAAEPVSQYNTLRERLLSGSPTVSILHLEKCERAKSKQALQTAPIGGVKINEFMILPEPNTHISYASSHFTVRSDGTSVIEFLQYRINANDTANITMHTLSPTTYKQLSAPTKINCKLGEGIEFKP